LHHARRITGRRRGQALVEFGLVIMLFVLLLSGVFDFGMLLNTRLSVSAISRTLARAAASGATQSQLQTLFDQQDHISGVTTAPFGQYDTFSGTNAAVVITETWLDNSMNQVAQPQIGGSVKIEVNAQGAQVITPLIRPFFGCSNGGNPYCLVHISATTIMRLEPNAVATPGP
jgi:Flp pilus assembly protein TadG